MKFFGTDGIRGRAFESLPLLRAYQLGKAIKKCFEGEKVVIGYDTRESSLLYLNQLINGLGKTDIIIAGVVPTPCIAFYSLKKKCVGIMITASHNPYYDNGFKIFINGIKPDLDQIIIIEKNMMRYHKVSNKENKVLISNTVENEYVNFIKGLNLLDTFSDFTIDASNGAASYILNKIFKGKIINDVPNGRNINNECGSLHIEKNKDFYNSNRVFFSLDGDSDRMLMSIDQKVLYGDMILYIYVKDQLSNNVRPSVSLSKMSNIGIIIKLKSLGIDLVETPVGDSHITYNILNKVSDIGSEPSGHFVKKYFENTVLGDGILISKIILDIISRNGINEILKWINEVMLIPSVTKNINTNKLKKLNLEKISCLDKFYNSDDIYYRLLIRKSGTENKIRITLSMQDEKKLHTKLNKIIKCIEGEIL